MRRGLNELRLKSGRLNSNTELVPIVAAIELVHALLELLSTAHPILVVLADVDERTGATVNRGEDFGGRKGRRRMR